MYGSGLVVENMSTPSIPPEARSAKTYVRVAGILAIIIAILQLIYGITTVVVFIGIGIVWIICGLISLWIFLKCRRVVGLIDGGELRQARKELLLPMILGIIFSWIIIGIILYLARSKLSRAIKTLEVAKPG